MTDVPNQWFDPHTLRKLSAQLLQVADILDPPSPPSPPARHQVVFPLHQIRESTWTPKLKKRGRPFGKKRKAKKAARK